MRERFGATDPKSMMLRFHTQTGGSTLTAQQPENNIVRVDDPGTGGGPRRHAELHTNGFDEALGLPTERAAKLALRTQQVLGYESGIADTVDPLAGSYFVESLTDEVERLAREYIDAIDARGGAVAAIESHYMQDEIESAAYEFARSVDRGDKVVVGVNRFEESDDDQGRRLPDRRRTTARPDRQGEGAQDDARQRRGTLPRWTTSRRGARGTAKTCCIR
jgi:methylmalonyl-CoA mutase N-terminal domain/subunit